jgi:2-polyprenyl-3-methyl-5-hydroxy-6-metoxy-1,4-benzoquinol methylase
MQSNIRHENQYFREIYDTVVLSEIDLDRLTNFNSVYNPISKHLYMEQVFFDLVTKFQNKRVLSIGGGIDLAALYLAKAGNQVVTVDLSEEAIKKTLVLAEKHNLQNRLSAHRLNWEESNMSERFDVVICHLSLHHMDWEKSLEKAASVLETGGTLMALEPVCLSRLIRFIHKAVPFYHMPVSENEYELSVQQLYLLDREFSRVQLYFMEALTRDSIAYCLCKLGLHRFLRILSQIDFQLAQHLPFWRLLSSHVLIVAWK